MVGALGIIYLKARRQATGGRRQENLRSVRRKGGKAERRKNKETGDIPLRQAEGHAQSLPLENLLGTIRSGQCEAYRHSPDEVPRRFNEGGALTREVL
jgi:hypothetical protein